VAAVAETIAVAVAEITTTGILKKDINLQSELKQHLPNMEVLFFKKYFKHLQAFNLNIHLCPQRNLLAHEHF
jgi:vacuolar-type H+-ATPase subunit C/Vma6